ncbi:RraA family protein [Paracoccus jeotgali]|uniref:RraA family protein n=1 Tax=Paracoccus jeotgali TaxID=2065379 RepID=UPI0028AC151D|nr:RraA family protein [Paracoccus jeotgali]
MTQLSRFGTATIHEAIGQRGALPSTLQPLRPGMRLAGPAFPVISPAGDNLMLHRAIQAAPRGSVVVADAGFDRVHGPWGDLMTLSAQAAGISGLLIAGSVRDGDEIAEYGFSVFSCGTAIRGTTKVADLPVPSAVALGGVTIRPGDLVIGDADGCVVVAWEDEDDAVSKCEARAAKEAGIRERMSRGEALQDIMGLT